jgi:peroxiredoxin (alkyl hydroperoxide reductase subunit C)
MPEAFRPGCQRPPIIKATSKPVSVAEPSIKEVPETMVNVGKAAPEFTAPAFYQGKFMNFSLSEFKGKWVVLCFYPGDFTFV